MDKRSEMVHARVSNEVMKKLKEISVKEKRTMSWVVGSALEEWVKGKGKGKEGAWLRGGV